MTDRLFPNVFWNIVIQLNRQADSEADRQKKDKTVVVHDSF